MKFMEKINNNNKININEFKFINNYIYHNLCLLTPLVLAML